MVRLLVGLGNPGSGYAAHRHNAGYWLVDQLAQRLQVSFSSQGGALIASAGVCRLMKPGSYMNQSGLPVKRQSDYLKIPPEAIMVAHDDLDLPIGNIRLKRGGGHGGHNGLRDLIAHLGSDFDRLRIGIGHPGDRDKVHRYVLNNPSAEEKRAIQQGIDRALDLCDQWLAADGFSTAQQQLNSN